MKKHEYISKLVSTKEFPLEEKLEGMEIHVISQAEVKGQYVVRDLYKPKSKKFTVEGANLKEHNKLVTVEEFKKMRADKKEASVELEKED